MNASLAWVVLALLAAPAYTAAAQPLPERPWRVVVLNDADPTLPAFIAIDRGLKAALSAPGGHPVDVFHEPLDKLRFPETMFSRELVAMLAKKYEALPVDAVVAVGLASLEFAEQHRERLWPKARILFSGAPVEVLRERRLSSVTTGFVRGYDLGGTAELAWRLRPSTRRLVVISGSGEFDRAMERLARTQLEPHAKRLAIEYWHDAPIAEFVRRIGELGPDDDMRTGLARLLRAEGYEVCTHASAGDFLLAPHGGGPGCIVLDLQMPGPSGLELQKAVSLPIVFLTGRGDIESSVRAMKAGAVDFLTKPVEPAELLKAVQAALERGHSRSQQREAEARYASLTARERSVFEHVVAGKPNKATARALGITERTVKMHRAQVMQKMRAGSIAELVRSAELLKRP